MGDVVGRAPLPPLLAYTASKQKELSERKGKGKGFGKVKSGASKAAGRNKIGISQVYNKNNTLQGLARPRGRKPEKKIEFDESARKEYLTGFQKRKQARIVKSKEKAKERERQEHQLLRVEAREARKKQAAENVAAEKVAYGDAGGGSEGEAEDADKEMIEEYPALPSAFENEEHHTTVMVQEWDPNESESEQREPAKRKTVIKEALPPSSRRMAKKLKNDKDLSGAREISKLMEVDEEPLRIVRQDEEDEHHGEHHWRGLLSISDQANADPVKKAKKPKFHYESKLDRAKARSQARDSKMKYAEKRREERNAGGPKGRMQKNKGKRGHGNKGSKKKP